MPFGASLRPRRLSSHSWSAGLNEPGDPALVISVSNPGVPTHDVIQDSNPRWDGGVGAGGEPDGAAGPRRVMIFASEVEYIVRCMLDCPDCETGGDLFGFWTHTGCPAVQYAIGPGPGARGTVGFFQQDRGFLRDCGEQLIQEFGLQHIGEWHSHHRLGLARPSLHDSATVRRAIERYGLHRFFLTIGTLRGESPGLGGFLYDRRPAGAPAVVEWLVLPGVSPFRERLGGRFDGWNYRPRTSAGAVDVASVRLLRTQPLEAARPVWRRNTWLRSPEGQQELREHFDQVRSRCPDAEIRLADDETVRIAFSVAGVSMALVFPPDYPSAGRFFTTGGVVVGPPFGLAPVVPEEPAADVALADFPEPEVPPLSGPSTALPAPAAPAGGGETASEPGPGQPPTPA